MQEQIVKNVSFSVINQETDGTVMVGFSDNTDPKQPQHYYIRVGEKKNGWMVKEADTVLKTMTLVKDEIEVELSLGDKSGSAKAAGSSQQKPGDAADPSRGRSSADGATGLTGFSHSRLARHRREFELMKADREEAKRKEEADRKAREAERLEREEERDEQRRQLEAIREELRRSREEKAAATVAEEKPNEEN